MTTLAQRSFAGGEIAPSMYARSEQVKYATGLRKLRNGIVMRHGGVTNRPGTIFVGEVKDSSKTVRQIPFVFNSDQTYNLEFGNQYMRVIRGGAYVIDLTLTITAISNALPGVVTYTGTDPVDGEEVYISGIVGAIGDTLNGRNFKIANVDAIGHTFELKYMDGTDVDTTAMGAYVSDGTAERIYTIATPYLEADLPGLRFAQSADIITITSASYAPRELARTGHANWTLTAVTFAPTQAGPTDIAYSSLAVGTVMQRYQITAVAEETGEESLVGAYAAKAITGATQANPCAITAVAHGFLTGDEVTIDGVGGMTELNGGVYIITKTGANGFTLNGVNSTAYGAYTAGGSVRRLGALAAAPTAADPHTITWTAAAGAQEYNIYKELNGIYGFIGVAGGTSFDDVGVAPDTTDTPPAARDPFSGANDYPTAVTYAQQRTVYGGTNNDPETGFASRTGQFKNFTVSSPLQDDDAVTFVLAGQEVNAIKHLLQITGKLVAFTSGGEHVIQGDADGIIKPGSPNPKQYSYNGIGDLRPLVAGTNGIYVQARGSVVRDAVFDEINGLRSIDLSIFSAHLIDGYTITDWTYQKIPNSIVWAVRSDGALLGFTYIREQEMVGWHRHDFDGTVEGVCAIPEGSEDALYLVIKRTINGATKRYIERMASRQITDILDAVFVDCGLSYDGRNVGATTMTLTSAGGWTYQDDLTLTASAGYFTAADVGNAIHLELNGDIIRAEIRAYTSATVVTVRPHKTVPVAMRAVAILEWGKAVDVLEGMWHIEGKDISVLADGFVGASPNNPSYGVKTIASGKVTLDQRAVVIHAGLPITSDLETLDPDVTQGETLMDKNKSMGKITVYVEKTRGLFFGPKPPEESERYDSSNPDPLLGLDELKIRGSANENYDDPVALLTGQAQVIIRSNWNNNGRVFLRQVDPLPFSVLAIAPAGNIPIRG